MIRPEISKQHYLKKRIFLIMGRPNHIPLNRLFNIALMILIIVNVAAVILETVESLRMEYSNYFHVIEYCSVFVFCVEYALRVWTSSLDQRYGGGLKGKIKYMTSTFAIIDLLAIAPSLFSILLAVDLRMLRAVRLFRIVRLLKLARYNMAIFVLVSVFRKKKPELIVSMLLGFVLMIFSASLMFFVEHEAQPDKFSSIPLTMWWAVSTLTTIGYGDVFPVTSLGKFLGSVIAFLGVGLFALPTAVLATGFSEIDTQKLFKKKDFSQFEECPHCGERPVSKKAG